MCASYNETSGEIRNDHGAYSDYDKTYEDTSYSDTSYSHHGRTYEDSSEPLRPGSDPEYVPGSSSSSHYDHEDDSGHHEDGPSDERTSPSAYSSYAELLRSNFSLTGLLALIVAACSAYYTMMATAEVYDVYSSQGFFQGVLSIILYVMGPAVTAYCMLFFIPYGTIAVSAIGLVINGYVYSTGNIDLWVPFSLHALYACALVLIAGVLAAADRLMKED